jgi:hypothetical protein
MHIFLPFSFLLAFIEFATAESCYPRRGDKGTCMTKDYCLNVLEASVSSGLCSGGSNNVCCSDACGTKGGGKCGYVKNGCKGTWQTGYCWGGSDVRCCLLS